MFGTIKKLFLILNPNERIKSLILLIMILITSIVDVLGIASIMPFMAIVSNPETIQTNYYIKKIFEFSNSFGITSERHFMFFSGIFVFLILVISLSFKALTTYVQLRFTQMCEYSISKRLLANYMSQPYSWYLKRNSADLEKNILSEVNIIIGNGLMPMFSLLTQILVAILIITFLLYVDIKLSISIGLSLFLIYFFIFIFSSKFLKRIGKERLVVNGLRFEAVNQIFGGFKAIKAKNLKDAFIKKFSEPSKIFARHQASSQFISMFPRFALEAVGFGGVIIIILYLMKYSVNFNSIIPIIALYVFAGYRLLPAIQIIYASSSRLKFVGPALNAIYKEIEDTHQLDSIQIMKTMEFNKEIVLKEIDYTYPGSSVKVLNNININIKTGNTIGIIGTTGSGKTTLVDLILGLLKCQTGSIQIDNQIINENNIKSWQNLIGYVPQNIYLLDDTIVANIAFGVPNKDVDQSKIERVSKIAKLHEFVVNELPEKYLTKIGDRGIRLSGGQCQRIGIARALYDNPKLIIFDEATSALDNITESEVMSELNNLDKNITIILVAHRLATVKKCDVIYYLEKGEIKDFGNYQKLSENHVLFKNQKY